MARAVAVVRWHVERQRSGRWIMVAALDRPATHNEAAVLAEFRRLFPLTAAKGPFRARRV